MKKLILLRHAKSSWKNAALLDFERPLSNRGKKDAPMIAEILKKKALEIDLILSSSSTRTLETANIFAQKLNLKIKTTKELYLASSTEIKKLVNELDENFFCVIIVAHNPGLTNLVSDLTDFNLENLPTTGLIGLSIEGKWKELNANKCKLLFFEYPKKLES